MNFESLIPIIVFLLVMIFGGARRRKTPQPAAGNNQRHTENTAQVDTVPENETVFPPFMENFEGFHTSEAELTEEAVESNQAVAEQSESEAVQEPTSERVPIEPPPIPVDSPTLLPTKPVPITPLIDPSPETFRQGVILAEILGRPKGLRHKL